MAAVGVTAGSAWGAGTFGRDLARMAREQDPGLIAVLWVAVLAKGLVAVLALAPGLRRPRRLPQRALVRAIAVVGALVLVYGIANLVQHLLMRTGAIATPAGLGRRALPWHLWLWDPYWILGGLLLLLAARAWARAS